jgi:hypothetical protein
LLAIWREAAEKSGDSAFQAYRVIRFYDCCAADRPQTELNALREEAAR